MGGQKRETARKPVEALEIKPLTTDIARVAGKVTSAQPPQTVSREQELPLVAREGHNYFVIGFFSRVLQEPEDKHDCQI